MDTRGWSVAAVAYGKIETTLTHAVDFAAGKVLCNRVKFSNILDDSCVTTSAPTCPICAKKLNRLNNS